MTRWKTLPKYLRSANRDRKPRPPRPDPPPPGKYLFQSLVEGAPRDPADWMAAHWREVQHVIPILLPSANVMRTHYAVEFRYRNDIMRWLWPGAIGKKSVPLPKTLRCTLPAYVTVTRVRGPRQRAWDQHNREYWCKPIMDALKGGGYIVDDNPEWLLSPPVIDIAGPKTGDGIRGPCIIIKVRRIHKALQVTDAEANASYRKALMAAVSDPGFGRLRRSTQEALQSVLEGIPSVLSPKGQGEGPEEA